VKELSRSLNRLKRCSKAIEGIPPIHQPIRVIKLKLFPQIVSTLQRGVAVSPLEMNKAEFGFYLINKLANKKEEWPLFFGCTLSDWEKDAPALGFGVDKALIKTDAFKKVVRKSMGNPRFNQGTDPSVWLYVAIPDEDLEAGSEVISSRLRDVWAMVRSDAE
jgi:hypothetical protein